jgi:hypothetical protein
MNSNKSPKKQLKILERVWIKAQKKFGKSKTIVDLNPNPYKNIIKIRLKKNKKRIKLIHHTAKIGKIYI